MTVQVRLSFLIGTFSVSFISKEYGIILMVIFWPFLFTVSMSCPLTFQFTPLNSLKYILAPIYIAPYRLSATGLYVGDLGSRARVGGCNVIRNGNGSQQPRRERRSHPSTQNDDGESMYADGVFEDAVMEDSDDESDDTVPPGHSGMYIETASCLVEDTLIAANSLTGLSVVRGGSVRLSGCDVLSNGADPVSVEDAHDMLRGIAGGGGDLAVRGGVAEGPISNYMSGPGGAIPGVGGRLTVPSSQHPTGSPEETGRVRFTPFPSALLERATQKSLQSYFSRAKRSDPSPEVS